jgi:hypothetical protein
VAPATGPVAWVLPQLPQVSQFLVSWTLSRTVVPAVGVGVGVGLGAGAAEVLGLLAAGAPPQELKVNVAQAIRTTKTAEQQIRKMSPPLVGTKWRGHLTGRVGNLYSGEHPKSRVMSY